MTGLNITLIALITALWIGTSQGSQVSQPFQNTQFPSWLGVQLVGQHLEINGIPTAVYAYTSTASHDMTQTYFMRLLQQWAVQESEQTEAPEVVFAETPDIHTLSQFKAPYFITVQHATSEKSAVGHISVANLADINTGWQQPNAGFRLPNSLVLQQRVTDQSPITDTHHDTLIYDSTASVSSLLQEINATLQKAGWQDNSLSDQPDGNCKTQLWVQKQQSLMLALCPKSPSGTAVVLIRESR